MSFRRNVVWRVCKLLHEGDHDDHKVCASRLTVSDVWLVNSSPNLLTYCYLLLASWLKAVNMRPTFTGSSPPVQFLRTSSLTPEERCMNSEIKLTCFPCFHRFKTALRETLARSWVSWPEIEISRGRGSMGKILKEHQCRRVWIIYRGIGGTGVFTHSDETGPVWRGDDLLYLWSAFIMTFFIEFVLMAVNFASISGLTSGALRDLSSASGAQLRRWPGWRTNWSATTSPTSGPPLPVWGKMTLISSHQYFYTTLYCSSFFDKK